MEKQSFLLLPWPRVATKAWAAQGQEKSHHSLPVSCNMALSSCTKVLLNPESSSSWRRCLDMLLMASQPRLLSWLCRDQHLGQQPHTRLLHYKPIGTGTPSISSTQVGSGCQPLTQAPATHSGQVCSLLDKDLLSTSQCWSFPERPKRKSGIAQVSTWIYKQQIKFSSYKTMF